MNLPGEMQTDSSIRGRYINRVLCDLLSRFVDVPEWLLGMTRNHVGFARVGSNPTVHAFLPLFLFPFFLVHSVPRTLHSYA